MFQDSTKSPKSTLKFDYKLLEEIELSQMLDDKLADALITSPHFWMILSHGLLKYYDQDGTLFKPEDTIKQGSICQVHQPNFEGEAKSVYTLSELILEKNLKKGTLDSNKITEKMNMSKAQLQIFYTISQGKPKFGFGFYCNTSDGSMLDIIKLSIRHMLQRVERLAKDPEISLRELNLISAFEIKVLENPGFLRLPRALATQFILPADIETAKKLMNTPMFLRNILPDIIEVKCATKDSISKNDICKIKFKNMNYTGSLVDEEIKFKVMECNDNILLFMSQTGVTHFHQFGYSFALNDCGNNTTSVDVCLGYSSSNLVSAVGFALPVFSMFTKKLPDPMILLDSRSRNILCAALRHVAVYFRENGVDMQMPITASQEVKASSPKWVRM